MDWLEDLWAGAGGWLVLGLLALLAVILAVLALGTFSKSKARQNGTSRSDSKWLEDSPVDPPGDE